jgi:hypothetical protein
MDKMDLVSRSQYKYLTESQSYFSGGITVAIKEGDAVKTSKLTREKLI